MYIIIISDMTNINLHSIFCHLVNDNKFLSTILEDEQSKIPISKIKKNKFSLIANIVTDYTILVPYETQGYTHLPQYIKPFLSPDYERLGIKNIMEKNMSAINISFLNSFNMLYRPDIYQLSIEDHIKNYTLLEQFLCHNIQRNCQIDKIKNTKKMQAINKELIKNLVEGKITHDLIQYIINIFEINLLVFDFSKSETLLYWTKGIKHPYFNLFKDVYCMSYIHGNYEPIMCQKTGVSDEQKKRIYTHILTNYSSVKNFHEIKLSTESIIYLSSWNLPLETLCQIFDKFFPIFKTKNIS
ncbi:hypothetical protein QLL95_gp0947 [Cotonvirus japonicus]|uniref:Uncharacterized protein n=1 Tax=Cotonvirus japonicus TaxID=2811091 RepID=A0ABM7NST0_9VIRU|nr:hypothetical protein QLL95_gp0947 [Cotonvirus japonicus]BCS83176.1 hypothetical protein [Cotonvirus japonicus]